MRPAARPRMAGLILLCAAALLYWLTLDNGLRPGELEGGDLITHQYAQAQARPGNAPGYPIYTMGGWLWFHGLRSLFRLFGQNPNPIPLLSSYSTLWALLSLGLLYQILRRITRSPVRPQGDWPLAWLLTAFYAVTYFFWYYATTTEQYTSAIAQTLAIVYVYLHWRDHSQFTVHRSPFTILLLLAFLSGLSLAHMVTVALIVPPLVAVVLWQQPGLLRRPAVVGGALLAAALPLVSYLYVYLRGAAHPEWWGVGEWAGAGEWFWSFVATAQGQDELSWGLVPGAAFFANGFPEMIWQELSIPVLVVGLAGIGALDKHLRVLLWGTLALYLGFCWVDRFGNWYQVILPAYPLFLLGVAGLVHRYDGRAISTGPAARRSEEIDFSWRPRRSYDIRNTSLALLALLILWRALASLPEADSRDRPGDTGLDRPRLLLAQSPPPDAGLFAAKDDALGLDYLIEIGGLRPDLEVVDNRAADRRLAAGERVLVTRDAAGLLLGELRGSPPQVHGWSGDWVELLPAGSAPTRQADVRLGRLLGDGIVLEGYAVTRGEDVTVLLFWSVAEGSTPDDWSISVRSGDGSAQQDAPGPVFGLRPFGSLQPGEVVIDAYSLGAGDGRSDAVDASGLRLLLYRARDGAFVNLAEVDLPLP